MNTQRYTWLDAVVEAEAVGILKHGEASLAHRLAHAIHWEPSDSRPSGLYWANELAASVVGVSRMTYYRNIKGLRAAGFFIEEKGNLLPAVPEYHNDTRELFEQRRQALIDAYNESKEDSPEEPKYHNDTSKYQNDTSEYHFDNPYSVDTYPVDLDSTTTTVADAPVVPDSPNPTIKDDSDMEPTLNPRVTAVPSNLEGEDLPKYQNDTLLEDGKKRLLLMNEAAKREFLEKAKANGATEDEIHLAAAVVSTMKGYSWSEKVEAALIDAGVVVVDWAV